MAQTIQSHTFDNGLVLVAEPMPWLESAAFTFLVPCGSVHDPANRAGLAGFTCEMALRGAGPRDNRQFVTDLDNLGVEHGEHVADTHTSYSGATLTANLPAAISIYADLLRRPHLPADQLESGRQVMFGELQSLEDDLHHKVMLELRRRHYREPWGRPSQGDRPGITETSIEDIQQQFTSRYQPAGSILGVAGRFDFAQLKDQIGELFGDWTGSASTDIETTGDRIKVAHLTQEAQQTQIGIAYEAVPYRHEDYYRAWAAVAVLSGGMSARLFTEVREKRGLCYTVYASYHSLRDRAAILCYAGTSTERAQETLEVTLTELTRMAAGIEPQELDRLRARAKSSLVMQQESSFARSSSLARDWYHLGTAQTLDDVQSRIDALTLEGINRYLAEHPPGDYTVLTLGPQPLEVPVGVS